MDHRGPENRCPADIFHPLRAGEDPTVPAFKQTEELGVGYVFKSRVILELLSQIAGPYPTEVVPESEKWLRSG